MSPPVSDSKPRQFAFVLSEDEMMMFDDLSARESMPKAALLRHWIRAKYEAVYGRKLPGAEVPATFAALVNELAATESQTVGEIARRMGVRPAKLSKLIRRAAVKINGRTSMLECVDGEGADETWELHAPRAKVIEAIAKHFDVHESFASAE